MSDSGHVAVAIGGVMLLAWYGLSRLTRREKAALPSWQMPEFQHQATAALRAELHHDGTPIGGGEVHCLDCGTPWPSGVLYCSCGGATGEEDADPFEQLRDSLHREASPLVCVFVADTSWKASLLRSYLESNEIECVVQSAVSTVHLTLAPAHRYGALALYVEHGDAERARNLLAKVNA